MDIGQTSSMDKSGCQSTKLLSNVQPVGTYLSSKNKVGDCVFQNLSRQQWTWPCTYLSSWTILGIFCLH